jgi:hypothetical protein
MKFQKIPKHLSPNSIISESLLELKLITYNIHQYFTSHFQIVFACLLAAANAGLIYSAGPVIAHAPVAVAPALTSSQYHAQDELGQYSYGYAGGPSAKAESKDAFGNVRGSYSYIDANGLQQVVNYVADPVNGFRGKR